MAQFNTPSTPSFNTYNPVTTGNQSPAYNQTKAPQPVSYNNPGGRSASHAQVNSILAEEKKESFKVSLPNYSSAEFLAKTAAYEKAFGIFDKMLTGKAPLSIKDAVFVVENAYFDNRMSYDKYDKAIKNLTGLVQYQLQQSGYSSKNPLAVNLMIQKVLFDTTRYKQSYSEKSAYHYPIRYDFDDFWAENDWTKMFVTKLISTQTGQCHSMPLLYLILCEELGVKAYLSLAPNHSYVRFADNNGILYNFETTNGCFVSNNWILGSSYINTMAVKNRIYMDTLSTKEAVAYMLVDLADGYKARFGYTDGKFAQRCADLSLKYYSRANVGAVMTKSNALLVKFDRARQEKGISNPEIFATQDPDGKTLWEEHDKYWKKVQEMGYMPMPKEAYEQWLKSVEQEKQKPENQGTFIRLQNSIH